MSSRTSAWLIGILGGISLLRGQSQAASPLPNDEPIATDRPAITASSVVVPKGSFQAENGVLISNDQGQRTVDGPETSVRFGAASNTELRFSAPDYFHDGASGFGDVTIGVKRQLGPTPGGFDVSVILFLNIPTGADAVSSHGYDPGLQLPWSRKLSANWSAAGQFALYWPTTQSTTGNSQRRRMGSSSMRATFLSAVGRATCCISGLRIRLRPDSSSTSISEPGSHPQRSIISLGLVTHFDFRLFVVSESGVVTLAVLGQRLPRVPL